MTLLGCRALAASTALICSLATAPAAYAQVTYRFDLPEQDLARSLKTVASRTRTNILFEPGTVRGKVAPALKGTYSAQGAIQRLLAGSDLSARATGSNSWVVTGVEPAQAGPSPAATLAVVLEQPAGETEPSNPIIIVTGTRIRGHAPAGAPVLSFDRKDFDRLGVTTIEELFETVPQAFGGSNARASNPMAVRSPDATYDPSAGSAINLRGLGVGTTLTLINGRRLARGGLQDVMDTSLIPLAAVARTEILLDGASAIYGSDAIGGVVNLIMRSDFDGAETRLTSGISSRGDAASHQLSQAVGTSGSSGYLFGAYSYHSQGAYTVLDRPFSRSIGLPEDLDGTVRAHSGYASGQYELAAGLTVDAMFGYTERDNRRKSFLLLENIRTQSDYSVKGIGASAGLSYELSDAWRVELAGTYGLNKGGNTATSPDDPDFVFDDSYRSDILTAEGLISGRPFALPAGDVQFVAGASFRKEEYKSVTESYEDLDRSTALFGELRIPVLAGIDPDRPDPRMVVTVAARYEKYRTWGSSFDPKVGAVFAITPALHLRGTYGTSFKAPTAVQREPFNAFYLIRNLVDPASPTGRTPTLVLSGNNPELQPETATAWTLGADYKPRFAPGLVVGFTYFNFHYKDRIAVPTFKTSDLLTDPDSAFLVRRRENFGGDFDAAVRERLTTPGVFISGCAGFVDSSGVCRYPVDRIGAIGDLRLANLASMRTSGLDLNLSYAFTTGRSSWSASANATYVSEYELQNSPGSSPRDVLDRPYRPLNFRVHANLGWQRGPWAVSTAVDYADGYTNDRVTPEGRIDAFTTVNLNAQYRLAPMALFRGGGSLIFNISNLFDTPPPLVRDDVLYEFDTPLRYDPANANPMGRYFRATFVGNW